MNYNLILTFDISRPPNNIYSRIESFLNSRSFIRYQTKNTYKSAEYDIDQYADFYYPNADYYDEDDVINKILEQEIKAFEDYLKLEGVDGKITMLPVPCLFNSQTVNK